MQHEMVVCPWNEFWAHYSPWTPEQAIVQKGVELLETAEILLPNHEGNKWAENIDPAAGPNENVGFRSIQEIAQKLEQVDLDIVGRQASYRLVHKPNQVALSTIPSGNHMIDGCFYPIEVLPNDPKASLELRRTASVHEYKRKSDRRNVHDASLSYLLAPFLANCLGRIV